jgi:peptide deformylase
MKNTTYILLLWLYILNISYAGTHMEKKMEIDKVKLKIVQVGEPTLRMEAKPLTKDEILSAEIQQLIILMKNSMYDAPGVGLAANQVGLPLQLIVIEDREELIKLLKPEEVKAKDRHPIPFHVIINPKIIYMDKDHQAEFYEGCLSLTGYLGNVSRSLHIKIEALNEKAEPISIEAHGWYARIIQHEMDHLNGKLYIDKMDTHTFTTVENYKKVHG